MSLRKFVKYIQCKYNVLKLKRYTITIQLHMCLFYSENLIMNVYPLPSFVLCYEHQFTVLIPNTIRSESS